VYLLSEVIARAGTGRQAVRRALAAVGSETPPFEGVTGLVAFDAAGDIANQDVYVGVVRGGTVEVADPAADIARSRRP
jgi:ABC-type branched-subunit amino acid transport system substrate-binding protein